MVDRDGAPILEVKEEEVEVLERPAETLFEILEPVLGPYNLKTKKPSLSVQAKTVLGSPNVKTKKPKPALFRNSQLVLTKLSLLKGDGSLGVSPHSDFCLPQNQSS